VSNILALKDLKFSFLDYLRAQNRSIVYLTSARDKTAKKKTGEALLEYLNTTNYFPDHELADEVERASKKFRKNFKIEPK
jgi:hypothetical protein